MLTSIARKLLTIQLYLAELARRNCYLLWLPDWSLGMSTLGEADGPAISELKWVFYIIETFKDVLNGCLWAYRESTQNTGKNWNSPRGLVKKTKDNDESVLSETLRALYNPANPALHTSQFSFKTAGLRATLEGLKNKGKEREKGTGVSLNALLRSFNWW